MERCDPPRCVRVLGHEGDCRPTWWDRPTCGAWMPLAQTTCARYSGHSPRGNGGGHRSSWGIETWRRKVA